MKKPPEINPRPFDAVIEKNRQRIEERWRKTPLSESVAVETAKDSDDTSSRMSLGSGQELIIVRSWDEARRLIEQPYIDTIQHQFEASTSLTQTETRQQLSDVRRRISNKGDAPVPATIILPKEKANKNVVWAATGDTETNGIVYLHQNGTVERLGADKDDQCGVIPVERGDRLYVMSNKQINVLKGLRQLDLDGLESSFKDEAFNQYGAVTRIRFNSEPVISQDIAAKRRSKSQIKRGTAKPPTAPKNQPTKALAPLGKKPVVTETAQEKTDRLKKNVETYTKKLSDIEQFATVALARQLKGRLWKPLSEKGRGKLERENEILERRDRLTLVLDNALRKQYLNEGKSEEEAAKLLLEHQEARQVLRAERTHQEMTKGFFDKVSDLYANLPKGKKIVIGVGAAAVLGFAGAFIGTWAGAGGVIGLGAAKVGKVYAQSRSRLFRKQIQKTPSLSTGKESSRNQILADYHRNIETRAKDVARANRNKRIAVAIGAASAVAVGTGMYLHLSDMLGGHHDNGGIQPEKPSQTGSSSQPPAPTPTPEFSVDAYTVTPGEGWYSTFSQMGITNPTEQANLLAKVGPQLQQQGWAYRMPGNSWGISKPGMLPKSVLELIQNNR